MLAQERRETQLMQKRERLEKKLIEKQEKNKSAKLKLELEENL
jgi:hypothetical protein